MALGLVWLGACLVLARAANAQPWWDSNWAERKKLRFNNVDQTENLIDFPVLVVLTSSRIDYAKTQDGGEDIRFIDADGITELAYEIELWDEIATSYVWVKAPQIDASSKSDHIWMYYDNSFAVDNQTPAAVWDANFQAVWHLKEDPPVGAWYNPSWTYRKKITIDKTKVAGTLSNFPVLISFTDTDIMNGAQPDGDDILFTDSDKTTKLDHEIEKYDSATGELVAWVRVPSLSSSSDKRIYIYYGNAGAGNQENAPGVWDTSFKGVWHLNEDPSGAAPQHADSTPNNNDGTSGGSMTCTNQIPGQINGSLDFDGANDDVRTTLAGSTLTNSLTFSAWFYSDDAGSIGSSSGAQRLVTQERITSGCTRLALALNSNRVAVYRRRTTGGANLHGTTVLTAQQWYHAAMTYDGSTVRVYLNGNEENSAAEADLVGPDPAGIQLGGGCTVRYIDGILDEVRVSNIVRSADWIMTEYNNQSNPGGFYTVGAEADSTSNANHGKAEGSRTSSSQVAGQIGGGVNLDGIDDYIFTTNSSNDPQNITVEAWFKTDTRSGYKMVGFENNQTGFSTLYDRHLYIGVDGRVYFGSWDIDADVAVSVGTLDDDQWHYAVGTQDDVGNWIKLYIDGVLQDSVGNDKAYSYTGWWRIGSFQLSALWPNWAGGSGYFPGTLDEVRISNVVRSGDWIAAQYKSMANEFIRWKPRLVSWQEVDPY